MKTPTKDQVVVYIYIAGGLLGAFFIYKVMQKFGLVKTLADKKNDQLSKVLTSLDYFDPMVLQDVPGYVPLGETRAKAYAGELYLAMHPQWTLGFGTDEEAIYAVFGRLRNKYNISEIAGYYQMEFSTSLLTDILNDLNVTEQGKLMDLIETNLL